MHNVVRVCIRQCLRDITKHRERVGGRNGAQRHSRAQGLTIDERHEVIRQRAGRDTGTDHRHDVRLLQPRRQFDLPRKPFDTQPFDQLRREHLDDHVAPKRRIARVKHARHPAATKFMRDRVRDAEGLLELFAEDVGHRGLAQRTRSPAKVSARRILAKICAVDHERGTFRPIQVPRILRVATSRGLSHELRVEGRRTATIHSAIPPLRRARHLRPRSMRARSGDATQPGGQPPFTAWACLATCARARARYVGALALLHPHRLSFANAAAFGVHAKNEAERSNPAPKVTWVWSTEVEPTLTAATKRGKAP